VVRSQGQTFVLTSHLLYIPENKNEKKTLIISWEKNWKFTFCYIEVLLWV